MQNFTQTLFMKPNKGYIIAILTGVAVAGVIAFLFGTDKGKSIRKKIKKNQGKVFNQAANVYAGAKEKFSDLKEELVKEAKKTQKFAEQFSDM
jgi:gas vesicle protein